MNLQIGVIFKTKVGVPKKYFTVVMAGSDGRNHHYRLEDQNERPTFSSGWIKAEEEEIDGRNIQMFVITLKIVRFNPLLNVN